MTIELVLMATLIGTLAGCVIFITFQWWELRHREDEHQAMQERLAELSEHHAKTAPMTERERAIARSLAVKHQKRRARQRKAQRRQK